MSCSSRDFDFGVQLGRGSFGVVFKARRKTDGRACVCKQIELKKMSKRAREEANQEVALLRKVSHGSDYIVQYMGHFLEDETLHIIMEFCEKGDLGQHLKARERHLEERAVWKFLLQIALGLRWLHLNRILHRDIKSLNVFLTTNDDVRLGDLGVARVLSHNTSFAHTFIGTPYYLSPELCEEKPYNELSDVWAFGCVIYEMCTLRHPFEAKNQAALLIKILRGQFAPIDASYSDELRNLIDGCMKRDWTKRTKLADMLAKPVVLSYADELGISLAVGSPAEQQLPASAAPKGAVGGPPLAPRPTSEAATGARRRKPPLAAGMPPKSQVPYRKAALDQQAQLAPPRMRVRTDPRAAGGSGSARRHSEDSSAARTATIVAPPASGLVAAQVIKNPPARTSALRQSPATAAPYSKQPAGPSPPEPKKGLPPPAPVSSAEERRRAAREVAELPDVVVANSSRQSRNVPTVKQLLEMEDSPVKRLLERNNGRLTKAATAMTSTLSPEEAAQAASAGEDEATLRPPEMDQDIGSENYEEVSEEEMAWEAPEDQLASEGEASVPEEEHLESLTGAKAAEPLRLRLLQPLRAGVPGADNNSLTQCSAFEDSLAYSMDTDSLAYSMGDTEASSLLLASAGGFAARGGDPLEEDEEEYCAAVPGGVEMRWGVEAAEETNEVRLQLAAKLDSDGLLCDPEWQCSDAVHDLNHADADHDPDATLPADRLTENLSGGDAGADGVEALEEEEEPRLPPQPMAMVPTAPPPGGSRRAAPDPRSQVARLSSQISRLYAEVVKDLDAPARTVWDELYGLFQAKMEVDLSDEDQIEIERYVFEHLPVESMHLIMKV
eukprot:TRINITY_DN24348_c0_g2_i1.p1 TRINITY_DN24348_c0_g2~~TRINITY_DN24348_c0_g2_i1.p1  ORF type:complete len:839 (-),score=217.47 TRINITY_DN24348_c0_g2_i1:84-2600(-)